MNTLNNPQEILDAALLYGQRGWRIFPVHAPAAVNLCACKHGEDCSAPGKKPHIRGYAQNASNQAHQIRTWWDPSVRARFAGTNIGMATGKESGCFVIDLDSPQAIEYAREHNDEEGYNARFPITETRKGEHWFFAHPGFKVRTEARIIEGEDIDVRGDGGNGIVILPPSHHITGKPYGADFYEPLSHYTPEQLPQAPRWILEVVETKEPIPVPTPAPTPTPTPTPAPRPITPQGGSGSPSPPAVRHSCTQCGGATSSTRFQRCQTCHAEYRRDRFFEGELDKALTKLARATKGSLNDTLTQQAYRIGLIVAHGYITQSEAESLIQREAPQIFARNPKKGISTMERQLQAGMSNPSGLHLPDFTDGNIRAHSNGTAKALTSTHQHEIVPVIAPPITKPDVPTITVPFIPAVDLTVEPAALDALFIIDCMRNDEYGDAELMAALYQDRMAYDWRAKRWYVWGAHYWQETTINQIRRFIPSHLAAQYLHAAAAVRSQIRTPVGKNRFAHLVPQNSNAGLEAELLKLVEALYKRASKLRFNSRTNNIISFLMGIFEMDGNQWDAKPWLLPCANGILQLKKGEIGFRHGQPNDWIKTAVPNEWLGIECKNERFEQFLSEILEGIGEEDHAATVHYVQNLLGYSILGSAHENTFAIFYGDRGQNGKGTLFRLLGETMGKGICGSVSEDVFLSRRKKNSGAASPHLMTLRGLRIAWCAETDEGDRLSSSQVKRLTGNEPIRARNLNEKEVEWQPTHTLMLMTNERPHVNASDNAIWIRIGLVPFLITFKNDPKGPYERQKEAFLVEKMTSGHGYSGILASLIRWNIRYQEEGLHLPPCLQAAKEEYRTEEDTLGTFIKECCRVTEDATERLERSQRSSTYAGSKELYEAYKEWWADGFSGKPMSIRSFSKKMKKRFYFARRREGIKQGSWFYGIEIKD